MLIAVAAAVAVLVMAAAVLVSRSRSGGAPAAAPNPNPTFTIDTAAPTTIDPQAAVRATIIRDYLAGRAAYDQATGLPDGKTPNFDLPALSEHMVGEEFTRVRAYIIGMRAGGLTALGPPAEFHPRVASITGTTAIVQDCYHTDDHIVDEKTHALHDIPGPVTRGSEATLQLDQTSGVWKIANLVTKSELCPAS
ncbi:MAG: hypothetical protein M3256_17340 [Actinomycetota bacterium]|nr:hypothetical protein [Actinomycetota bacterium]